MKIYRSRRIFISTGLKPSALADNPHDLHNSSNHTQPRAIIQGPKLTFLYRRQVATENFFFSRQMKKSGRQKAVCKIFVS